MSHDRQPEIFFSPFWSVLVPSRLYRQTTDVKKELFPSVVRRKTASKKGNAPLPSVAHERLGTRIRKITALTNQQATTTTRDRSTKVLFKTLLTPERKYYFFLT